MPAVALLASCSGGAVGDDWLDVPSGYEGDDPGECDNGLDDDGDHLTDCMDPACFLSPFCTGGDADADGDADEDAAVPDADDGSPAEGEDGAPEVAPTCGDGVVDPEEECDDGNAISGDGCETDCTWTCETGEECGDGQVCNGDEVCADHRCSPGSAAPDGSACAAAGGGPGTCRSGLCSPASCGNGLVDPGEDCDDGDADNTDDCLSDCEVASCGDGFVHFGVEQCEGDETRSCSTSCGTTGSQACSACSWTASCTPPTDVCNGVDDDCVGGPDQGFPCPAGSVVSCIASCGTTGTGLCSPSCELPAEADCLPPSETCNGADDDCDLAVDETFDCVRGTSVSCTTTCGSLGSGVCTDSCALPTGAVCIPPTESCSGNDDDCDGTCDEGFACCAGRTQACSSGSCSGIQTCLTGCTWGTCDFGLAPAGDSCSSGPPVIPDATGSTVFTGSTCAAANDVSDSCGSTVASSPDVVYSLVLGTRRTLVLDTIGTSFDAVLFLLSGGTCPGAAVVCDDNSAGSGQARISTILDPGTYWVVLDGAGSGNRGAYVLNVAISDPAPPCGITPMGAAGVAGCGYPALAHAGSSWGVVFEGGEPTWSTGETMLQQMSDVATMVGSRLVVTGPDELDQMYLAATSNGTEFALTWMEDSPSTSELRFARVSSSGTILSGPTLIVPASYVPQQSFVTYGGTGWLVVFKEGGVASPAGLYLMRVTAAGSPTGSAVRLTSTAAGRYSVDHWAGARTPDGFAVLWVDDRNLTRETVIFGRYNTSGTRIGAEREVSTSADNKDDPAIAWNGTGFGIAYSDRSSGNYDRYFARLDSSGGLIAGSQVLLNSDPAAGTDGSIVFDGTYYWVAWRDTVAGVAGGYFAKLASDGTILRGPIYFGGGTGTSPDPRLWWNGSLIGVAWCNGAPYFGIINCP